MYYNTKKTKISLYQKDIPHFTQLIGKRKGKKEKFGKVCYLKTNVNHYVFWSLYLSNAINQIHFKNVFVVNKNLSKKSTFVNK